MVRSGFLLALLVIGYTKALNISEFKSISNDVGVADDWAKLDPRSISADGEDFGIAFGGDKLYLVSRRNGSAVHGGIVSALVDGKWKHAQFAELETDNLQDELFTLSGRLLMLTTGEKDGRIIFSKLFAWDEEKAAWADLHLDIQDKDNVFQPLTRGPHKFVSVDVPDMEGKLAFVVASDHEMSKNDSETSFSRLDVAFDASSKPINASLKFVKRIRSDMGKAVIASALKDNRLYALVAKFASDGQLTAQISIDYSIDLATNNRSDGVKLENASMPNIDYTVGKDRIFQAKDALVFLGPHMVKDDKIATRHVWDLDLGRMKMQDVDGSFPNLPNRIFAIDQKQMRLLTAGLKKGAYAATISA